MVGELETINTFIVFIVRNLQVVWNAKQRCEKIVRVERDSFSLL